MRVAHRQQHFAQPRHQLGDVLGALGQEIFRLDPTRIEHVEMGENDLERSLEDLGLAAHAQEIAGLERPRQLFGGVPEPGADAACLVAQLELEVKIALAVGSKLLVGNQVRLVDRVTMR